MDISIRIGGAAGQGIQSIGAALAKFFCRSGFHVFTNQDYMSRIKGGHNFYQVRISELPLSAALDEIDILLALDQNSIAIHHHVVRETGIIVYDQATGTADFTEPASLAIPLALVATEANGTKIMANNVALGALLGLMGQDLAGINDIIQQQWANKGAELVRQNIEVAKAGYDFVLNHSDHRLAIPPPSTKGYLLLNGSQAISLGALVSGCKFYAAYPMTPSTGIMVNLAAQAKKHGIVVEQAEDEIAAINMALGASYGGVRAMTGTSGGGFALMTEGVSLAGMTETPVVIAEVQRPGPATGLPTRTEQSDLLFILYGGHGEFPRVVFAPGSPSQAIALTNKAFDLAEKYQIPAFILSDQYLADCQWSYAELDTDSLTYTDYRLRNPELEKLPSYQRYQVNDTGISPLAIPGESSHLVVVDSDEHDEDGHIIEDAATRNQMVEKRLFKKLRMLRKEIAAPELIGHRQPEILLLCWGSTYGVVKEVTEILEPDHSIAMLHFSELFPFPASEEFAYLQLLDQASQTISIENNAGGQFAKLLRAETGFGVSTLINKYDGRPFTTTNLLGELNEFLG